MNVFFKSLPLVASLIAAEIAAAETIKPDDFRNLYGIFGRLYKKLKAF